MVLSLCTTVVLLQVGYDWKTSSRANKMLLYIALGESRLKPFNHLEEQVILHGTNLPMAGFSSLLPMCKTFVVAACVRSCNVYRPISLSFSSNSNLPAPPTQTHPSAIIQRQHRLVCDGQLAVKVRRQIKRD